MQSIYQIVNTATAEPLFTGSWSECYEKKNGTVKNTYEERDKIREQWRDTDTIKLWDADDYSNSDKVREYITNAILYIEENHFKDSDTGEDTQEWIDYERSDLIYEAAENVISVYNGEILSIALEDLTLASSRSELSADSTEATAIDLITTNIYEQITEAVNAYYVVIDQHPELIKK